MSFFDWIRIQWEKRQGQYDFSKAVIGKYRGKTLQETQVGEPKVIDTGVDAFYCDKLQGPAPYYVKAYPIATRPGCWNHNRMVIIERETGKEIGEYERKDDPYGYSSPARTFHPFKLRGNWYALYSKDYTATRVMSLPDCKDLGGEKPECFGFCPTDYWVPPLHWVEYTHDEKCPRNPNREGGKDFTTSCKCLPGPDRWKWHFPERVYGFIAGCIWGDDSNWKIQYLDLSRADEGVITREERFGYIELPQDLNLSQAIHLGLDDENKPYMISIDETRYYNLEDGKILE